MMSLERDVPTLPALPMLWADAAMRMAKKRVAAMKTMRFICPLR
jgi:hypothetical protein